MSEKGSLLAKSLRMVGRHKCYILWFYLVNLMLAGFGTSAFSTSAHAILDHSLNSGRLLHGFEMPVIAELFGRAEFGRFPSMTAALCFAILFFVTTALFLPGVFQGYASKYPLPREDFFRACGKNLWRFIRLMTVAGIVMGAVAGGLFAGHRALLKKAADSTNEWLWFEVQVAGGLVIFLVMTTLRIWFDLAQADTVLSDQSKVRKSIRTGFRHTFRSLGRLLVSYVVTTIAAAIVLVGGLWIWMRFVAPANVFVAFLVSQFTLLLLLIPRFWQRGVVVAYWQKNIAMPVVAVAPEPVSVVEVPEPTPVVPS